MDVRTLAMLVAALLVVAACDRSEPSLPAPAPAAEPAPATSPVPAEASSSFVNKVWQVAESGQVAVGSLRVFLSDGTLVMTDPHSTSTLGAWRYDGGRLTIIEESREYPTDIRDLSESAFRIRMHGPGEPIELLFEPAGQPAMGSLTAAKPAAVATPPSPESETVALWGTAWRLEYLAGAAVPDGTQPTLEFASDGRASGNGSCNRFNGVVTITVNTIRFDGIAATRKACAEAVMRQEDAYFAALREAGNFEVEGETLRIYPASGPEPLRFAAMKATAERPAQSIERVPTTEMPALTGIWTVVGHHLPGTGSMNDEQARARYGESVRLTASTATSSGAQCAEPRYTTRRVEAAPYLASEFGLPPGSLRPLAARDQIHLMEVSCAGARWVALGARLLEVDADRVLAPWDGVFFELRRDRDFRALGQEPGWQLEVRKGAEMRFIYDYGRNMVVTPASRAQLDSSSGTRTYHAVAAANDLRVVIVPVPCTDVMSGKPFPVTVSVTLNGRSFRGCGEELATPYQG